MKKGIYYNTRSEQYYAYSRAIVLVLKWLGLFITQPLLQIKKSRNSNKQNRTPKIQWVICSP